MIHPLSAIPPFSSLPPDVLESILGDVREVRVPAGRRIFEEGDTSDVVCVTREGRVRLQHLRPDGSARTVCMIGQGEAFPCLPALDGGANPATAVAAEPTVLYRMPGPLFRSLMERHPAFARAALGHFCTRLRESGCDGCAGADDAGSRLAGQIVRMHAKFGDDLPLTRKELAELAGTTVETAIRLTREFEDLGWLALERAHIVVRDQPALERRSRGVPRPGAPELLGE